MSGLPVEQQPRFVPHLTLIRAATTPLRKQPVAPIDWPVEEFVLIRSILHEQPARYETRQRYRLCGGPPPPSPTQYNLLNGI
jgi:2'-5' RNA ligase